jgi:hypothetical protein
VLTDTRREIDRQIAKHQTAMARNQTRGNADYARSFRRMIRMEEQDRRILERMISNLLQRFPPRVPPPFRGEVLPPPPEGDAWSGRINRGLVWRHQGSTGAWWGSAVNGFG